MLGSVAGRAGGLLDGRACTTHYSCCTELALLAPKARVLEDRLYVEDYECHSSAGITAGIDLMLYIVSQLTDQSCAVAIARYLVVYLRRSGADPQLSPWLEGRNHIHPAVQDTIASDLTKSWTLSRLAKIAGASSRHLSRLFNQNVGMSIKDYGNRLRVALAKELLSQTSLDPALIWNAWRNELASPLRANCVAHGKGYMQRPLGKRGAALIVKPPVVFLWTSEFCAEQRKASAVLCISADFVMSVSGAAKSLIAH